MRNPRRERLSSRPEVPKLDGTSEPLGGLSDLKVMSPLPEFLNHWVWGKAREHACLTSSQGIPMPLAYGTCFEKHNCQVTDYRKTSKGKQILSTYCELDLGQTLKYMLFRNMH